MVGFSIPFAGTTLSNVPLPQCYRHAELNKKKKKRAYEQRIREIEFCSLSPLVFWTCMGPTATVVFKRLASLIADKQDAYSTTLFWLRCKLSFSLMICCAFYLVFSQCNDTHVYALHMHVTCMRTHMQIKKRLLQVLQSLYHK